MVRVVKYQSMEDLVGMEDIHGVRITKEGGSQCIDSLLALAEIAVMSEGSPG